MYYVRDSDYLFSAPKSKKVEFVRLWEAIKVDITQQPELISGMFHWSLKPESVQFHQCGCVGKRRDILEGL